MVSNEGRATKIPTMSQMCGQVWFNQYRRIPFGAFLVPSWSSWSFWHETTNAEKNNLPNQMENNPSLPIIVHHFPPNKTTIFHNFPNRNGWWKKNRPRDPGWWCDGIPRTKASIHQAKKSSICRFPKRGGTPKSSIFIGCSILKTIHFRVSTSLGTPIQWTGLGSTPPGRGTELCLRIHCLVAQNSCWVWWPPIAAIIVGSTLMGTQCRAWGVFF